MRTWRNWNSPALLSGKWNDAAISYGKWFRNYHLKLPVWSSSSPPRYKFQRIESRDPGTCTPVSIAALFRVAKKRAPLVAQWGKKSGCNWGDLGSIPGLGRSPGGGHRNPLQYPWSLAGCMGWQGVGHDWMIKYSLCSTRVAKGGNNVHDCQQISGKKSCGIYSGLLHILEKMKLWRMLQYIHAK